MKCGLLVTTRKGQELAGTLTLSGKTVSALPKEGYEVMLQSVMDDPVVVDGGTKKVWLKDDPRKMA